MRNMMRPQNSVPVFGRERNNDESGWLPQIPTSSSARNIYSNRGGNPARRTSEGATLPKVNKKDNAEPQKAVINALSEKKMEKARNIHAFLNLVLDKNSKVQTSLNLEEYQANNGVFVNDMELEAVLDTIGQEVLHINLSNCCKISHAGFSSIGNKCPKLRKIKLSNCEGLTINGLREVVTRCKDLDTVDLSQNSNVNDKLLNILLLTDNLQTLFVQGCDGLKSAHVAGLIHNMSTIRVLDCSDCAMPSGAAQWGVVLQEFFSPIISAKQNRMAINPVDRRRLKNIREVYLDNCSTLVEEDVAKFCRYATNLTSLSMINCKNIGVKASKGIGQCPSLINLQLAGCKRIGNRRREYSTSPNYSASIVEITDGCKNLKTLNLSRIRLPKMSLERIKLRLDNLLKLDLTDCTNISDQHLLMLRSFTSLRWLSISGCTRVTIGGLKSICGIRASHCYRLTTLLAERLPMVVPQYFAELVDNLPLVNITTKFLTDDEKFTQFEEREQESRRLEAREVVKGNPRKIRMRLQEEPPEEIIEENYHPQSRKNKNNKKNEKKGTVLEENEIVTGFTPKSDADIKILSMERMWVETDACVIIQRGYRAYKRRVHLAWLELIAWRLRCAMTVQCAYRSFKARIELKRRRFNKLQYDSATKIRSIWKMSRQRLAHLLTLHKIREFKIHSAAALKIQNIRRMYLAKLIYWKKFDARRRAEEEARRWKLKREYAAKLIQGCYKSMIAYRKLQELRKDLQKRVAYERYKNQCALLLQRVIRGYVVRVQRQRELAAKALLALQEKKALVLQQFWRAVLAQREFQRRIREAVLKRRNMAANDVQRVWRGNRGRFLASVMRAYRKLEDKEQSSAVMIQKAWRRYRDVCYAKVLRETLILQFRRDKAAVKIQRLYRANRRREAALVLMALAKAHSDTKPLRDQRDKCQTELDKRIAHKAKLEKRIEKLENDTISWAKEIDRLENIKDKWTDSACLNGLEQRYKTTYLRKQLVDLLEKGSTDLRKSRKLLMQTDGRIRELNRMLRKVNRELEPLEANIRNDTIAKRRTRVRAKVLRLRKAATKVQSLFRGFRVRVAAPLKNNYWMEGLDEETGKRFYLNTWNQKKVWIRPIDYEIFGPGMTPPTSDGWSIGWDSSWKCEYYFNKTTGEYRWETPASLKKKKQQAEQILDVTSWWQNDPLWQSDLMLRSSLERFLGDWEERKDPQTGFAFYHHPESQAISHSLPPSYAHGEKQPQLMNVADGNLIANNDFVTPLVRPIEDMPYSIKTNAAEKRAMQQMAEDDRKKQLLAEFGIVLPEVKKQVLNDESPGSRKWFLDNDPLLLNEESTPMYYAGNLIEYQHNTTYATYWHVSTTNAAYFDRPTNLFEQWFNQQEPALLLAQSITLRCFGDWLHMQDPSSCVTYFHHQLTSHTSFFAPMEVYDMISTRSQTLHYCKEWREVWDPDMELVVWFRDEKQEVRFMFPPEVRDIMLERGEITHTVGQWTERFDEESEIWWFRDATGEMTWEFPEQAKLDLMAKSELQHVVGSWTVRHDPITDLLFWNHAESNTISWTIPEDATGVLDRWEQGNQANDWQEQFDPKTGEVFWTNIQTGESSTSLPQPLYERSTRKHLLDIDGWQERKDPESGVSFWYNINTDESEWTLPKNALVSLKERSTQCAPSIADWQEVLDPNSNERYWYNETTGVSQWEVPQEIIEASELPLPDRPERTDNNEDFSQPPESLARHQTRAIEMETWDGIDLATLPPIFADKLRKMESNYFRYDDRDIHVMFLHQHIESGDLVTAAAIVRQIVEMQFDPDTEARRIAREKRIREAKIAKENEALNRRLMDLEDECARMKAIELKQEALELKFMSRQDTRMRERRRERKIKSLARKKMKEDKKEKKSKHSKKEKGDESSAPKKKRKKKHSVAGSLSNKNSKNIKSNSSQGTTSKKRKKKKKSSNR